MRLDLGQKVLVQIQGWEVISPHTPHPQPSMPTPPLSRNFGVVGSVSESPMEEMKETPRSCVH